MGNIHVPLFLLEKTMFNKRTKERGVSRGGPGVAMDDKAWISSGGLKDKYLNEPAILTCIKLIVSEMGSLRFKAFSNQFDKELTVMMDKDAYKILYRKANNWQTTSDFIRQLVLSMIANEDTFILLSKFGETKPIIDSMTILDNGTVTAQRLTDGAFKLSGNRADGKAINPRDLIWIKSPLFAQGQSLNVLSYAETLINLSYNTLSNADTLVSRGPQSPGVIEVPDDLTDEQFDSLHQGVNNTFKKSEVLILDAGAKWVMNPNPMRDYEFDKNRLAQIKEIATLFGIPLPMLGISDSAYKSYEEVRLAFHASCLYPFMKQVTDALEEAWEYQYTVRFDVDEYASVPLSQRVDTADKLVKLGAFHLNEARVAVGKAPVPELQGIYAVETNNLNLDTRE